MGGSGGAWLGNISGKELFEMNETEAYFEAGRNKKETSLTLILDVLVCGIR